MNREFHAIYRVSSVESIYEHFSEIRLRDRPIDTVLRDNLANKVFKTEQEARLFVDKILEFDEKSEFRPIVVSYLESKEEFLYCGWALPIED
jgi:hypothetical protein